MKRKRKEKGKEMKRKGMRKEVRGKGGERKWKRKGKEGEGKREKGEVKRRGRERKMTGEKMEGKGKGIHRKRNEKEKMIHTKCIPKIHTYKKTYRENPTKLLMLFPGKLTVLQKFP